MFNPSPEEVRKFFVDAWHKYESQTLLEPLEIQAVELVQLHPELHELLRTLRDEKMRREWQPQSENPFLHLSLHLALREQYQIDQPHGVQERIQQLYKQYGNWHDAWHHAMGCLIETLQEAQLHQGQFNAHLYLECLQITQSDAS